MNYETILSTKKIITRKKSPRGFKGSSRLMGKELQVAALENGTAIDHIPTKELFKVVTLLQLQRLENRITIGNNLKSRKMGAKGIIKVADKFFREDEINRIALVAPNVNLNIIRDYEVAEKRRLRSPTKLSKLSSVTTRNASPTTNR